MKSSTQFVEPQPSELSPESICTIAETFAETQGYYKNYDIEKIVKNKGGKIEYEAVDDLGASGSIEIRGENDFSIALPLHTNPLRDRFTVAHELGHYVLHYLYPIFSKKMQAKGIRAKRYGSGLVEQEANTFAAAFLMPEKLFKEKYQEFSKNVYLIADFFKVSVSTAAVRISVLGLEKNGESAK